jgi:subtilisin family serine protease
LWLSVIAPPVCCTIGTEAVAVLVAKRDWPVAYESLPPAGGKEVKATIGLPSGIEIDGAFADWSHLASKGHIIGDPSGDVSGGDDADVDILQIADILETSTLDIATTVRGTELSGTVIPFETHRLGASGPQTGQTQPSAQAPPPEPRLGTDRTEIFLSTGNGMGYRTDWLIADAQYLIAIEGRNGRVISSILEKFTGASEQMWAWAPVGSIPAATGGPRIEAGVTRLLLPGISDSYSIFVRTTDWNRSHEDHAVPAVRPLLQFAIATFDPLEGLPGLPPAYVTDQASGYFVVQLDVPVTDVFLVTAEALGATALDFIPTFGMVVHLPSNDPSRLEGMDHVRWVGIHQPAFRVDPLLLERTGTLLLKVSTYQRAAEVAVQIKAAGGTIDGPAGAVMKVEADAGQLPAIAAIPDIKFIEPALTASIHNEIARGITNVNLTNTVYGLTGKGQIIAIADTGLDTGNDSDGQPDHPDFNGRVVKWYDVVRAVVSGSTGNYTSDRDNHGTHVAGTAVGGGNASNRALRGVAPEASIIVQGMEDDSGALQIYSDLHDLYSGPYTDGARVHQNSWGYTESGGKYNSDCQETDDFVWGNGTMVIVYSAGNDGKDGSGDANTTSPPGTSKNVITVGASENLRPTFDSWGDNASQVASFSSRGGTLDGRIKPDIVAPGTWILSTRSADGTSAGWGYYSQYYFYEGGTSQAAPHVSGAALLVRQYYTDYENITPSAALVKATLINGADDMGMPDIPNMNEGWGRLNLTNSLFPEKPRVMRYIDNNTGLNYSDSPVLLNFTVGRSGVPLKFSLVWSDYPGSSAAADSAPKLINDLDITVTAPNSSQYKGNVFSSGWSATGGSADKFNNVECVYITSPECGTYEVNITPANITKGPQPFALVISGELVPDLNVTNITIDPANAKSGDDVRINATIVNCGSENLPPLFKESFTGLDPGVSENITDVAFSPSGDFALLVGTNRTVVKYSTSSGTFTTLDTSGVPWTDFEAVAFNPQNHPQDRNIPEALLVGTNGTVVDYNGTGFNTVSGPASDESLLDVAWNDNGTLALIVGNGGRVYTFPNMSSVFSDDFESGDGNWQFSGNTHWANTTAQSTSPTHSMHIKTGGGSSGADNYIYLKTDQNISGSSLRSAFVEFQNRYKTPSSSGATSYDQVYISKDGSNFNLRSIFFSNSANTIGWTKEILDIYGYYPTATFNILFYQTSDSGAPKGDWWIDDVHINKTVYAAASLSSLDSSAVLHGVQFVPGTDDAIMVGDGGIAWKYSGGTLSSLTSGTASDLRALSFKPQNSTCIIVGANGTVMRYLGNNDTFSNLSFPDSNASFWDVAYRQDFSVSGPKPDCSQALLVGASGTAWQYFGYDDHFNNVSVAETKTFYGVAFNNTRYPLYGPGLLVGYGSGPVVNKDSPEMTFRPFLVDFYTDNSSYSSNWLGRVQVDGGLAPDPYPPWGVNVTVSFLWTGAPSGSHNITVRVDITNNESASPPSPDRINEVEEWTNNQMSMNLLLVPEFNSVLAPLLCVFAGFALFRRMGFKKRGRAASFKHRPSRFGPSRGPGTQPRRIF